MSKELHVFTIGTKSYIKIIDEYFLTTLPPDIDYMNILYFHDMEDIHRTGTAPFEIKKLERILHEIRAHMGHNLFFIDGDVVFAEGAPFKDEINEFLEEYDVLFQFNDLWYNFGVLAIACNERTEEFFRHFLEVESPKIVESHRLHDQHVVNAMLGIYHPHAGFKVEVQREFKFEELKHAHLPLTYFANHFSDLKYPDSVPEDVILFHATNTINMEKKIKLLSDFKHDYYDSRQ